MNAVQTTEQDALSERNRAAADLHGVAGWVLEAFRSWRRPHKAEPKRMQLVETLHLGGKRQLMLVTCGGESFLVGGGPENVETIIRLKPESISPSTTSNTGSSCR